MPNIINRAPQSPEEKLLAIKALESEIVRLRKQLSQDVMSTSNIWGSISTVRGRVTVDGDALMDICLDKDIDPTRLGKLTLKSSEANLQAAIAAGLISEDEAASCIKIGADSVRVTPNKDAKLTAETIINRAKLLDYEENA